MVDSWLLFNNFWQIYDLRIKIIEDSEPKQNYSYPMTKIAWHNYPEIKSWPVHTHTLTSTQFRLSNLSMSPTCSQKKAGEPPTTVMAGATERRSLGKAASKWMTPIWHWNMEHKLMYLFLMAQLMVYCWYSLLLAKWPVAKTIPLKFQKVILTKSNTVEPKI